MIPRSFAPVLIVAVCVFTELGLTAFAIDNPQEATRARGALDAVLNDEVETLLRTDAGLAESRVRVQTQAGVVTLGGTVADEQSLQRAQDLVSSVQCIREIRNDMVVDEIPK
jgi:hyperosmotically inducible periplasmic protein